VNVLKSYLRITIDTLLKSGTVIPVERLGRGSGRRKYQPAEDSVKVLTMHSSKGLEFPVVIIPCLEGMPNAREDVASEAKLLYVAMTRAMDHLVLTHHGSSPFVGRLNDVLRRAA